MRDHVADANPSYLYKAAETIQLPDYILDAPMLSTEDVSDLHDRAFADAENRMFPIHTKEASVMSALAFFGQGGEDARTKARIRNAAAEHGVFDLEQSIESCFNQSVEKSASGVKEPLYALKVINDDGYAQHFYPISSTGDVMQSARYLTKDASENRLPLSVLRSAAMEIVKRANELNMPLKETIPAEVINIGEDRIPSFDNAIKAAELRKEFCDISDEAYNLLIETVKSAKEAHSEGEDLEDFVDVWRMVDHGSQIKYSHLIQDPYKVFFSGETRDDMIKFAKSIVFVGETPIPSLVVGGLKDQDIEGHFRVEESEIVKQARDSAVPDAVFATQTLSKLNPEGEKALLTLILSTTPE